MAYFDQGVVFGANTSMPGVGVSPNAPGNMGLSGPNVPFIQWAPRGTGEGQLNPVQNFLRGGIPTSSHIHSQLPSNDFIQSQFTAKPWLEDKSHLLIREGMLVFATTELDAQIKDLSNMVSLPKMNEVLYRQHYMFQKHSQRHVELRDFHAGLVDYTEKQINGEIYKREHNEGKDPALDKVIRGMRQSVMRYQTASGILNTWKLLGGVLTVSDATTGNDMYSMDGADKVVVINVVMGKRCMMGNVWGGTNDGGNVDVGTHLWLILKRRQKGDGSHGEFQFFPYASKWRASPPTSQLVYGNPFTGDQEMGVAMRVGIVTLGNRNDPCLGFRQTAAGMGVNSSVQASYEAHAKIPMIEVQIGM